MHVFTFLLSGVASWFSPLPMYGTLPVCAMNAVSAPANIVIINEDNGNEASCRVIGTGPFVAGRVLDVSPSVAKQLGFYDAGTAHVRVYLQVADAPISRSRVQPVAYAPRPQNFVGCVRKSARADHHVRNERVLVCRGTRWQSPLSGRSVRTSPSRVRKNRPRKRQPSS